AARARLALGIAASSLDRNRLVSDRAAMATVSVARYPDLLAGVFRSPRILSQGLRAVSHLAGPGPRACRLGLCRNDGASDPAEAAGLSRHGRPPGGTACLWWRYSRFGGSGRGDPTCSADRSINDDLSVHGRGRDSAWSRCRLAG